jgi:hypothetical protein
MPAAIVVWGLDGGGGFLIQAALSNEHYVNPGGSRDGQDFSTGGRSSASGTT